MRSMPGNVSSGNETPTSTRMLEPPQRSQRTFLPNSPSRRAERSRAARVTSVGTPAPREREVVLERQLLGPRLRAPCRAPRAPAPSAARGPAEASAFGERLAPRAEAERRERAARAGGAVGVERAGRAASARARSRRPSAADGRRRAAGRRGCAPVAKRRRAHGEVAVLLRRPAAPRNAAPPRAAPSPRPRGSPRAPRWPAVRIGVATL